MDNICNCEKLSIFCAHYITCLVEDQYCLQHAKRQQHNMDFSQLLSIGGLLTKTGVEAAALWCVGPSLAQWCWHNI